MGGGVISMIFNPVVLAGGVGSRLWPLSRSSRPKQFKTLVGDSAGHSLLQQTFLRLGELELGLSQLVCNQEHRFLAAEQCRTANVQADIVLEPLSRNTAPAVFLAALRLVEAGMDDPMLVLSADHSILDEVGFRSALTSAHELAVLGNIVTLGVEPSFACTGYGYVRYGLSNGNGYKVEEFVEKPDQVTAQQYLNTGNYLWNSGMFIVRPSVLLKEAESYCADLLKDCRLSVKGLYNDLDFVRVPEREFSQCDDISLDYAIMERTKKAVIVPVDCGWNDIGDFQALWKINKQDHEGNVLQGDVIALDSNNCLLKSESRLVAVLGLEGLAVIDTKDAVLVAPLDQAQKIKDMVSQLQGRSELTHHREVYRPWGSYESIDSGANYQVKRISVNPGAKLSLQRHRYRAEHWVVVIGLATVHLDGVEHSLKANDSIYIEVGAIHSLANNTPEPLSLVEVQSGSYLGEDDIERLEDLYGRT